MKIHFYPFWAILCLHLSAFTASSQTPTIVCPRDTTVATSAQNCTAIVNNIDPVVSPSGTAINYYISSTNELGVGSASGKSFPVGLNLVKYFVSDHPDVYCTFTVKVEDHTPPVITCPADITVACASDVPLPGGAQATDGCTSSGAIKIELVSEERTNVTCVNRYTLVRTYRATDDYGNSSTCSQNITVYDEEPPSFNEIPPMSPLNVSCASNVPARDAYYFTAYDACTPDEEIPITFREAKTDSTCPNKFTLTRTWTATDFCGNARAFTQIIHVNDSDVPEFNQHPESLVTVSCASAIPDAPLMTATDNCTGGTARVNLVETKSGEQCANKFKLTRLWTATDACGNTSTYSQTITVNDTEAPVFNGSAPVPVSVSCSKDIPAAATQTATDNCGKVTINISEVKSNVQCANRFTLTRTWTATDECGNSSTRTQVINVNDNEAPKLTGISATPVVLWPPNHKMQDVAINYTATDNCQFTSTLSVTSSDPVNGGSDGDQSPDWEVIDAHHVRLRAEKANNGQARYYTITITVTDSCNAPVTATVTVVVAHNIVAPQTGNPFKVGSTVSLSGVFWDKPGNTHTAKWLLDGSAAANGVVSEPSGNQNGKVTGSYKFNSAGVYKLQMNVTDQNGVTSYVNTNNDLDAIVVIYDPNGGNAYGGGWFQSPAGALTANISATGKASYGFSVNYTNAAKPKGETQFEFKQGAFEFDALNFDYLSVNGAKAQFKGTGKIGSQSGIGFLMTIKDGSIDGSGIDKIRMKIYNRNTGYVYYDNQPGANDADDPTTAVGTNSSIVIQGPTTNSITTTSRNAMEMEAQEKAPEVLQAMVFPNPSNTFFSLQVRSNDHKTKLVVQIFDQFGRLLDTRTNLPADSIMKLGLNYRPGVYFVKVIQGSQHAGLKLLKR